MQEQEIKLDVLPDRQVRDTEEKISLLEILLKAMGLQLKKTFSEVGSVVKHGMDSADKAITGTGKLLRRTVASFDQLNRLQGPRGGRGKKPAGTEQVRNITDIISEVGEQLAGIEDPVQLVLQAIASMGPTIEQGKPAAEGLAGVLRRIGESLGLIQGGADGASQLLQNMGIPTGILSASMQVLSRKLAEAGLAWNQLGGSAGNAFSGMAAVWNQAGSWFQEHVASPVGGSFGKLWQSVREGCTQIGDGVRGVWQRALGTSGEKLEEVNSTLAQALAQGGSVAATLQLGVTGQFQRLLNGVIDGINGSVAEPFQSMNTILGRLSGMQILGMRPFRALSWRLPVPRIPHLAQGAVLPANRPFLAVVGDQSRGTNVEAPLATIQQAVSLVMEDQLRAIMTGFQAVIDEQRATRSTIGTIEIGDTVIGQAADRYLQKLAVMGGA